MKNEKDTVFRYYFNKEEYESLNRKLGELTVDEMEQVTGGLNVLNLDDAALEELLEELGKDDSLDQSYAQGGTFFPVICSCGTVNQVFQKSHVSVCTKCGRPLRF